MKKLLLILLIPFSIYAQPIEIELTGDSTQAAYTASFRPSDTLQGMIDNKCGTGKFKVTNTGWGGTTADQALTGLPVSGMFSGQTFLTHVQSSNAKIIIANWGINDNNGGTIYNKWQFAWRHTQMAQIAKSYGKIYIAETTHPLYTSDTVRDARIWEWAMTLISVGAQSGYPVIDQWNGVSNGFPFWNQHLLDGIHPAQTLYYHKAFITYKFLKDKGYLCL
jgi:hypothetical protein